MFAYYCILYPSIPNKKIISKTNNKVIKFLELVGLKTF